MEAYFFYIFHRYWKNRFGEHEIKLSDNTSFKEPYRRIPPGMFEVRHHLKEMSQAGAIRESKSGYCSNVVLAKKSDGSLQFCIDLRKLNN